MRWMNWTGSGMKQKKRNKSYKIIKIKNYYEIQQEFSAERRIIS